MIMEKTKVDKLKELMKGKKAMEEKQRVSPAPPPGETPAEEDAAREVSAQIKAAEDEAKAHYDKLLRVMAEFENFKKRIERERTEQAKYANQTLIHDLLPVVDDFDRVLDHIPQDPLPEIEAIASGVRLIQNHFMTALGRHGFTQLERSVGKAFDPTVHEAVAQVENKEYPEGTVVQEHRKGWKLYDRIVRPATVSVAKKV